MEISKIKRRLYSNSVEELEEIRRFIGKLIQKKWKEKQLKRSEEAWEVASKWEVGKELFCCASGTFLGGPIQRGDRATVYVIQPRKKIVWLKFDSGKICGFNGFNLNRYLIKAERPENPIGEKERAMADKMGSILDKVYKKVEEEG